MTEHQSDIYCINGINGKDYAAILPQSILDVCEESSHEGIFKMNTFVRNTQDTLDGTQRNQLTLDGCTFLGPMQRTYLLVALASLCQKQTNLLDWYLGDVCQHKLPRPVEHPVLFGLF